MLARGLTGVRLLRAQQLPPATNQTFGSRRVLRHGVGVGAGFVEFDLKAKDPSGGGDYTVGSKKEPATGKVTRLIPLPNRVPDMPREQYVLDSPLHGLSMNHKGTKLCVAGTMSDYAAIVRRKTMQFTILDGKGDRERRKYLKPYWSTEGPGNTCWMSMSGSDAGNMASRAVLSEDGKSYLINGRKSWVTSGPVADIIVLFTMTEPEKKHKGISAFIIETDKPGFSPGKVEPKLGIRASATSE